jgi:hypothetical protein
MCHESVCGSVKFKTCDSLKLQTFVERVVLLEKMKKGGVVFDPAGCNCEAFAYLTPEDINELATRIHNHLNKDLIQPIIKKCEMVEFWGMKWTRCSMLNFQTPNQREVLLRKCYNNDVIYSETGCNCDACELLTDKQQQYLLKRMFTNIRRNNFYGQHTKGSTVGFMLILVLIAAAFGLCG